MGLTNNLGKLSSIITSTGSAVGIGTSSPFAILTSTAPSTGAIGLGIIGRASDNYGLITYRQNDGTTTFLEIGGSPSSGLFFNNYANIHTSFATNSVERMRITSTGNVGIGTTAPASLLDVRGATPFIRITDTSGTTETGLIMDYTGGLIRGGLTINYGTGEFKHYCGVSGNAYFQTFHTNGSERMRITSGGNVGIGTTTPNRNLHVLSTASETTIAATRSGIDSAQIGVDSTAYIACGADFTFRTGGFASGNEKMRITSGGSVGIGTSSPIYSLDVRKNVYQDWLINFQNSNTDATEYGLLIQFVGGTASNNSGSYFLYAGDSGAQRFSVRGNGGIYNFQANDSNLSDIRTKKDIFPLESYWNKFKAIEIVKFKYKDQDHDDFNIGVIAQQVEGVAPEFIDTDYWENPSNENKTEMKSVYTTDLYHATIKVLQEAMAKIEELEARIKTLENK